jgi:hypothetical protein
MSNSKKELFSLLASKGCYLPEEELELALETLKFLSNLNGYFDAIDEIEDHYRNRKEFADPKKGAYSTEEYYNCSLAPKLKIRVGQVSLDSGNIIQTYESIYEAAKAVGKKNSGPGNISKSISSGKVAYGYKWCIV